MRLVLAVAAAALVSVPPAGAATLRTLVIRATGGPELQPAAQVEEAFRAADAFYRRSSFGALGIQAELTPPIPNFLIPSACFSGGSEPGLGAFAAAAKSAAAALGYDLAAYASSRPRSRRSSLFPRSAGAGTCSPWPRSIEPAIRDFRRVRDWSCAEG